MLFVLPMVTVFTCEGHLIFAWLIFLLRLIWVIVNGEPKHLQPVFDKKNFTGPQPCPLSLAAFALQRTAERRVMSCGSMSQV